MLFQVHFALRQSLKSLTVHLPESQDSHQTADRRDLRCIWGFCQWPNRAVGALFEGLKCLDWCGKWHLPHSEKVCQWLHLSGDCERLRAFPSWNFRSHSTDQVRPISQTTPSYQLLFALQLHSETFLVHFGRVSRFPFPVWRVLFSPFLLFQFCWCLHRSWLPWSTWSCILDCAQVFHRNRGCDLVHHLFRRGLCFFQICLLFLYDQFYEQKSRHCSDSTGWQRQYRQCRDLLLLRLLLPVQCLILVFYTP